MTAFDVDPTSAGLRLSKRAGLVARRVRSVTLTCAVLAVPGGATAGEVETSDGEPIDRHGTCRSVHTEPGWPRAMVPTRHQTEWNRGRQAFLAQDRAGTDVRGCHRWKVRVSDWFYPLTVYGADLSGGIADISYNLACEHPKEVLTWAKRRHEILYHHLHGKVCGSKGRTLPKSHKHLPCNLQVDPELRNPKLVWRQESRQTEENN